MFHVGLAAQEAAGQEYEEHSPGDGARRWSSYGRVFFCAAQHGNALTSMVNQWYLHVFTDG